MDYTIDGTGIVNAGNKRFRTYTLSAIISGNTQDTLDSVVMAAIDHTGAYPRFTTLYWDSDSTETNLEVAMVDLTVSPIIGSEDWTVVAIFKDKDQ